MNSLADLILARSGTSTRLRGGKVSFTQQELVAAAREAAASVVAVAGKTRPTVTVALPLSVDAVVHLVAAILGDYTICFLDPTAPIERRDAIASSLCPDVIVDPSGMRAAGPHPESSVHSPGYVAMSSGSTGGQPKAVLSPWPAIADFAPHGAEAFELEADCHWAELSHPAYDMAMTNLLVALGVGALVSISGTLGDRLRPLRFVDRVNATHVRLAPQFIDLAVAEQRASGARSLVSWGSGGDRLNATQVGQLFSLGVPTVVNTYGTSETIGFASSAKFSSGTPVAEVHGSVAIGVGRVGDWTVDLTHAAGVPMLRITSPHLPAGYLFGDPGEFPRWTGHSSVLTGDIGAMLDANLYCLGRAGRRVKRNGSFVDLDDVDASVREVTGLTSFTTLTRAGTLVCLVEANEAEVFGVRRRLAAVLRPDLLPERVVPTVQLPRLGNGKVGQVEAAALAERAM